MCLPELRRQFITFEAEKQKKILYLEDKKIEASLRLRIVEDIRQIPEINLSNQQLMLSSIPALMTRIHLSRRRRQLNLAATKIQAMFQGYKMRRVYLEIRKSVLTIQRCFRMLKVAHTWNFVEAMRNVRNSSACTIQKYLRGYLVYKRTCKQMALESVRLNLLQVNEYVGQKQQVIKENLQVQIAYLFRKQIKIRRKQAKVITEQKPLAPPRRSETVKYLNWGKGKK